MNRLRGLRALMIVTILGITTFQAYWLKQNYDREKKNLLDRANITFRESIRRLQGSKLKIEKFLPDSQAKGASVSLIMDSKSRVPMQIHVGPKEEIISTINILKQKLMDSLNNKPGFKAGMIISSNSGQTFNMRVDSTNETFQALPGGKKDNFFRMLYDVDSLQDTLKLTEIKSFYSKAMAGQHVVVPYTVTRLDSFGNFSDPIPNQVTVGFAHPVTYQLDMGNSFKYLIKRIGSPIIFSFFLIGITILSFALLYRNLLRQRRLATLKNEFISNITHELKTPIATVGVAIEALKNFNAIQSPERTKEYLDISSNELQRLSLLVDKVLKLSMFEKKEIELQYENLNIKDVVDEVAASMRLQIEKYHGQVHVSSEGDLNMEGDRLHLLSVVFNLLDNALKYSKKTPNVNVELKGTDKNVMMSISDNGIGIADEFKDKLFEKFFRVPTGDTHNAKGYGLGLSYVAHVVQKHKGTITVDSHQGGGSKFVITLPREQS